MVSPSRLCACLALALCLSLPFPPCASGEALPSLADIVSKNEAKYRNTLPRLWGERLPGIVTSLPASVAAKDSNRPLALTLDACGGKADTRIIALLRELRVPATIFATNIWLRRNRDLAADLAADPLFTFACHGKAHKPASVNGRSVYGITGTGNIRELVEEVEANARAITSLTTQRPCWYRSGTAYYDEVALAIIRSLGLSVAGYTVSADQGATLPAGEVAHRLLTAPDRAIILCHLNHPLSGTYEGLAKALPTLLQNGTHFTTLPCPDGQNTQGAQEMLPKPLTPDVGSAHTRQGLPSLDPAF